MPAENKAPYAAPGDDGHFGPYGGRFVSETLMHALDELTELYTRLSQDPDFRLELLTDLSHYVGRPTPLYLAERLLRGAVGLLALVPNMALALPAFVAGAALIVTHRFLKGDPSPVDLAQILPTPGVR